MKCPECAGPSRVVLSRTATDEEGGQVRRRCCRCCGHLWYGWVPAEQLLPNAVLRWEGNVVFIDRELLARMRRRQR